MTIKTTQEPQINWNEISKYAVRENFGLVSQYQIDKDRSVVFAHFLHQ